MNETTTTTPVGYRPSPMRRLGNRVGRRLDGRPQGLSRRAEQRGLALLDVMVGMAIFGLLVLIAIRATGQYYKRGYQTAVMADAQQTSHTLTSNFAENQTFPTLSAARTTAAETANSTALSALGVNLTKNNIIWSYSSNTSTGAFSICLVHTLTARSATAITSAQVDAYALFDSASGAITKTGRDNTNLVTDCGA